ncbi:hypothetical protein V6N11_059026 [Hibiscus sabdariffa]|uniref:Uncharacterized protein n=1 Tax=Hibiscus sabdariffa TaxID=183260 RepID=A0ABR2U678_9ROSI
MESECSDNPALNSIEGSRGRPSETIVNLAFLNPLERPGSRILEDLQKDLKKSRNHEFGGFDHRFNIFILKIGNNSFDASVEVTTTTTVNNAMEVVNRKMKNSNTRKDVITSNGGSDAYGRTYDSRFNALTTLENTVVQGANLQSNVLSEGMSSSSLAHDKSINSMVVETSLQGAQQSSEKGSYRGVKLYLNRWEFWRVLGKGDDEEVGGNGFQCFVSVLDAKGMEIDTVVLVKSSLNKANHAAVRVAETTERPPLKETNGRILSTSITMTTSKGGGKNVAAIKGISRTSAISKKKMSKPSSQPALQKLVTSFSSELDKA